MKISLILFSLFFIFCQQAWPFTLVPSRAKFPVTKVTIKVSGNSCANNGLTPARILDLAMDAMDEYWNRVPTTAMKLVRGDVDNTINLSTADLDAALALTPTNHILIGCSNDPTMFDSASILGVGSIGLNGSGHIAGTLLLNDALVGGENHVATLVDHELRAVLAHEIGHALGIGHSGNPIALMYYSIGRKVQERLTQDDYDAITYLYPRPQSFGTAGCGQVEFSDKNGPGKLFLFMVLFGFLLSALPSLRRQ